jgi:hypothetical protein
MNREWLVARTAAPERAQTEVGSSAGRLEGAARAAPHAGTKEAFIEKRRAASCRQPKVAA